MLTPGAKLTYMPAGPEMGAYRYIMLYASHTVLVRRQTDPLRAREVLLPLLLEVPEVCLRLQNLLKTRASKW